jgi:hypothetical protein
VQYRPASFGSSLPPVSAFSLGAVPSIRTPIPVSYGGLGQYSPVGFPSTWAKNPMAPKKRKSTSKRRKTSTMRKH